MSTLADRTYTPDDLLAMPEGKGFELVDGHLVERPMGIWSSWVGGEIYGLLREFVRTADLGLVWPADMGIQCFADDATRVRRPDVTFVHRERVGEIGPDGGYLRIAPDLVVEVVSPHDLFYDVDRKVDEYLGAGVRLVWIVNPRSRSADVYRSDGSTARLRGDDELSGEDVVPGFRCALRAIFPPVQGAGTPD